MTCCTALLQCLLYNDMLYGTVLDQIVTEAFKLCGTAFHYSALTIDNNDTKFIDQEHSLSSIDSIILF